MKRRSFFKSFMGLVATVALAPEIAFGRKLEMTAVEPFSLAPWQEQVLEALKGKNTFVIWGRQMGKQWVSEQLNEWQSQR